MLVVYLAGGGPLRPGPGLVAALRSSASPPSAGLAAPPGPRRTTTPADTPHRRGASLAREFWAYTAPRAIARVTQTALKRSDIVLVAALASPADAALYTAATRFIVLGQLFVQSVQQALSPQISRAVRPGRDPGGQLGLPGRHARGA